MEDKLKHLVGQRGRVKASLTRIEKYIFNKEKTELKASEIKVRIEKLESLWEKFDSLQSEIEELDIEEEHREGHILEREKFETFYFSLKSKLDEFLLELNVKAKVESQEISDVLMCSRALKIPPISLPTFNGNFDEWVDFYNTFKSLIHDNRQLSNIEKHHYLKSVLKGPAAELISSLPFSDNNYIIAWQSLCQHYHNNRLIIDVHLRSLTGFTKIKEQTASALQNLYNVIDKHIKALATLDLPVNHWDVLLLHILTSKLDNLTLKEWEEEISDQEGFPSMDRFKIFLRNKGKTLESYQAKCSKAYPNTSLGKVNNKNISSVKSCLLANTNPSFSCHLCKGSHYIFKCKEFLNKSIPERWNIIKKLGLCSNCFSINHEVEDCKSSNCKFCHVKHNSLLHGYSRRAKSNSNVGTKAIISQSQTSKVPTVTNSIENPLSSSDREDYIHHAFLTCNSKAIHLGPSQILLQTANIFIEGNNKKLYKCRVVLDSGSMLNFLSLRLASQLNLQGIPTAVSVKGIGPGNLDLNYSLATNILSTDFSYRKNVTFHVLPDINSTLLPHYSFSLQNLDIPTEIHANLADPKFNVAGRIDAILGTEIYSELFNDCCSSEMRNFKDANLFRRSKLGWVASGKVVFPQKRDNAEKKQCLLAHLQDLLSDSKQLSLSGSRKNLKEQISLAEALFRSHRRTELGNFIVDLPLKEDPSILNGTLDGALSRFLKLERKFIQDPVLFQEYKNFISEFRDLKHMELVPESEVGNQPNYYLPHHAVFKESTTTHLRVVFDASFKGIHNKSLNDILDPGPALQNDLFEVLLRFRKFKYALSGDICKMFRMIYVNPDHKDLQRILWRDKPNEAIKHYRLRTVTYGTSSAPFLAIRCLHQLANEVQDKFPEIALVIKQQFYMDDLLYSGESEMDVKEVQSRIVDILRQGGFVLRKWCTNSENLLGHISASDSGAQHVVDIAEDGCVKTLGLVWRPTADTFEFRIHGFSCYKKVSKRAILSDVSKCFDPLGFLIPVTILGKLFVQELWQIGLGWDETIPDDLRDKWLKYRTELQELNKLSIPRHMKVGSITHIHGFCDASQKAYGCCIYVVSQENDIITSTLVCAKARVAPLKSETLPRLELCGAVMLAELMCKIVKILRLHDVSRTYWTDSQIVLAWIRGIPQQWKTYVANRVATIQKVSRDSQWRYVPSGDNAADLASRGSRAARFKHCRLWWSGPKWLLTDEHQWPVIHYSDTKVSPPERREIKYSLFTYQYRTLEFINKFSTWRTLVRVTSWILRFLTKLKSKLKHKGSSEINPRLLGDSSLDIKELERAKLFLYKAEQQRNFAEEIRDLNFGRQVQSKSTLRSLSPFLDENGITRVGGRLNASQVSHSQKQPIVLPKNSYISYLICRHIHIQYLHTGPQSLLAIIRQEYWPLNGKNICKHVVRNCMDCFKVKPKSLSQIMGHLPAERVTPSRPFTRTGIDFCGPVYIRSGIRKVIKIKAYVAVFVCFCTRAVHIELVTDLSTNAFLAALRRFFARRGKCSDIFSDNATNFVGASRELRKLFYNSEAGQSIKNSVAEIGTAWHFIPAVSPHFGGLWEAAVKSLKHHLVRVAGKSLLTFEEMYTLLCEIEACLNSRPLTPCSSDPSDFSVLTPAHFLTGSSLNLPQTPELTSTPLNRLKRWQLVQASMQQFWKRWSLEYLSTLQQRSKWTKKEHNLCVGTLVLIKEDNVPPLKWRLGRVETVYPGFDGCVRVASVKLPNGNSTKRAIIKLCPLPIEKEPELAKEEVTVA